MRAFKVLSLLFISFTIKVLTDERTMYLKKIENKQEKRTREILDDIASQYDARIFSKIRVADTLIIENSGLPKDEYSYALKAHFDCVVVNKDSIAEFAVEFDGLQHKFDTKSIHRDELKNNICRKLNFPLLRITSEYFEKIGRFPTILSWITELYFLQKLFYAAQDEGEIPQDEPWMWFSLIDYDPVVRYKAFIRIACDKGLCCDDVIGYISGRSKERKSYATLSTLKIQNNKYIANFVECVAINFYAIPAREISIELSDYNIYKNFRKYIEGNNIRTYTCAEVSKMRSDFIKQHKICSFNVGLEE
jgi:hypothetical protein